jgi:hypothetical protein
MSEASSTMTVQTIAIDFINNAIEQLQGLARFLQSQTLVPETASQPPGPVEPAASAGLQGTSASSSGQSRHGGVVKLLFGVIGFVFLLHLVPHFVPFVLKFGFVLLTLKFLAPEIGTLLKATMEGASTLRRSVNESGTAGAHEECCPARASAGAE